MTSLTYEQKLLAIEAFSRWLEIYAQHSEKAPIGEEAAFQIRIDADHSALLFRLLSGKEPLPVPPPTYMSRPWHSLIETGEGQPFEVWDVADYQALGDLWKDDFPGCIGTLFIGQSPWGIEERVEPKKEWIVFHPGAPGRWRVWDTGSTEFGQRWKIARLATSDEGSSEKEKK